ncbi:MAG: type II toxin-antitoxin system Phd/YefM family antitoxin [Patescibacteria group bacterium]
MSQNTHTIIPAASAKNRFGEMLDTAQRAPVVIQKHGRTVAVLLSKHEYDEYQRLVALDDAWWGEQARRGRKGGMLGVKKTREYINSVLHARN